MKLFFYSCDKEAPFTDLYEFLDSGYKKLLISNHKQHIANFETYKDRILDEAIGDTITDKKILVPETAKAIFSEWLKEKYDDDAYELNGVFNAEDFCSIGADQLNNFIREMKVEEGWEGVVKSDEPNSTLIEKKQLDDTEEDKQPSLMQLPSLMLVGMLILIIIIITVIFYDINSRTPINGNGKLAITTSFSDSDIYINGEKLEQKTPIWDLPVPAGNNIQIKIIPPDNDVKMCATIDLSPGESINIGDNSFKNCVSQ